MREVIYLGSRLTSLVLAFIRSFFNEGFYNGGMGGAQLEDL